MPPPCCMVSAASRRCCEDAAHVVGDRAHDEAVEQRDGAPVPAPARMRPAGRNLKSAQRLVEAARPIRRAVPAPRPRQALRRRGARCPRWSCRPARRRAPSAGISCPRSAGRWRLRPSFRSPVYRSYRTDRTAEYLQKQEFPRFEPLARRTLRRSDIPIKQRWFIVLFQIWRTMRSLERRVCIARGT